MAVRGARDRSGRRAVVWLSLAIPALVILYGVLLYLTVPDTHGQEVQLRQFLMWSSTGEIDRAVLLDDDNRVFFERDRADHWVALPSSGEYRAVFLADAVENDTPLDVDQQPLKSLLQPATYLVPALLIVAAFLLFMQVTRSGSVPFLRSSAREGGSDTPVTFADVAGLDDAVAELREVRDYLKAPERFAAVGAVPPRGVLLVGPPGTGKTLLARAVAGEADVPFFSISGTDFVELYVGVGAARVRDLFKTVRESAPAILFIDELDALGRARSTSASIGQDERDQTLNQLLVELDGFERQSGIVLIGATNRPDILDAALLRRGRFDRHVTVDRPDRGARRAILDVHARSKRLEPSVDLDELAAATSGMTGADLASVLNEAALLAARHGRDRIAPVDLDHALDRVLHGSQGNATVLTEDEKRAVAYHEAGHAVAAWAFPAAGGAVRRISIVSHGRRLGGTSFVDEQERQVVSRDHLEARLAVMMAGRAAERAALGEVTSSARDDLRRATDLARHMVCELGMSDVLGPRALGRRVGSEFLDQVQTQADYSAASAEAIDREVTRLLTEAEDRARHVLDQRRGLLDELARTLVARETLREVDLVPFATQAATASTGT